MATPSAPPFAVTTGDYVSFTRLEVTGGPAPDRSRLPPDVWRPGYQAVWPVTFGRFSSAAGMTISPR